MTPGFLGQPLPVEYTPGIGGGVGIGVYPGVGVDWENQHWTEEIFSSNLTKHQNCTTRNFLFWYTKYIHA